MASVPTVRRPVKPVSGTCKLVLEINGTPYGVTHLQPHPEVAGRAIRLHKADGDCYDIAVNEHGTECSCPDYIFRRANIDPKGCKHIAAARACGLL